MTASLQEMVTAAPDDSARQIAAKFIKANREAVIGIVAAEVDRLRRAHVRHVEASAFGPALDAHTPTERTSFLVALDERFKPERLADFVSWGKATVEDHERRISFLQEHIRGCEKTIERHRTAIASIHAAGVTCLEEVEGMAA